MDRYEEALAKARAEYEKARKQGYTWLMDLLEGMFPEMKESEDERVRQGIIAVIQWAECFNASSVTHEAAEIMLAWLEKQKDLDKMIVVSPEVWDNAINDAYKNGKKNGEKQKEQKFTEKQDYSDLTDLERAIHRGFLVVGVENVPVTIINETAQDCLAQMKPAEWSEEDERFFDSVVWHLRNSVNDGDTEHSAGQLEDWLKSLKNRGNSPKSNTNSPSWKPSQAQMRSLNWWKSYSENLASLHEDLKKLMEDQR